MGEQIVRALWWLVPAAAACIAVGQRFSAWLGWLLFALILAAQLLLQYRGIAKLEKWTRNPFPDDKLEGDGVWDVIFGRLYRHERELRNQIARRDEEMALLIAAGQALIDGVVLLDAGNHILFCNSTAERQLGLLAKSDRGQHIANLVRQPEFVAYLEAGEFERPLTFRSERFDDRVLSIHIIPYGTDQRLVQVKDVSSSERLDRMRRDFVANVSHELRTPLTVLAGFVETLQEIDVEPEERKRYLDMMADQSKRMQSIVQDLLTLSAIESAPPPDDEIVDMAHLIDKLYRDAEALSEGRHHIIVDADGQGDLRGSESELVSALGNLVSNAVRYTPAGGTLRIQWRVSPSGAEFAVMDNGIGIDPKHLPRLTERFYRVDRSRSRDSGGTGLGLAIVKHSLNRHQAVLDIKSAPGAGSRFAARFPASRVAGF